MESAAMNIDRPNLGKPLFIAGLVIFCFFGVFLGWSLFAPLESAAIAMGEVGAEGKQKVIKHLEGGIVADIRIRDGDRVSAGQVLIELDRTQPLANVGIITSRYHAALALQARLLAERDSLENIVFPTQLLEAEEENVQAILAAQENIFRARRDALQKNRDILNQHVAQSRSEISGLQGAVRSQDEQLSLARQEVDAYRDLEDKGMSAGKTRMLAVKKDYARVEGERSQNAASISRTQQSIGETQLRISTLEAEQLNEVVELLRDVQSELYDLDEKLRAARDVLHRTVIKAPLDGTIVGLQIHTRGGVIGSGEVLLGIVPADERLVIEARLDPKDIDVVQPGLAAHVRFSAFSSRTHAPVEAEVINVSADRFTDERSGAAYYKVAVVLTGDVAKVLKGETLYPGMQAEVMIVTGSRTPMDYLLEPLTGSINRAFRES
jgi:membrane fusion protein, type I secretion system